MGLRLMNATPMEMGLRYTTNTPKSRLRKPSADITIGFLLNCDVVRIHDRDYVVHPRRSEYADSEYN